jgi:hypothetical protein
MAKRHWKDHPAVGLHIAYRVGDGQIECKIVDVKSGPMFADMNSKVGDVKVSGSLLLRLKPLTRHEAEFWTKPIDGESVVRWAEKQRGDGAQQQGGRADG